MTVPLALGAEGRWRAEVAQGWMAWFGSGAVWT